MEKLTSHHSDNKTMNRVISILKNALLSSKVALEHITAWWLSYRLGKQLTLTQNNLDNIKPDDILLFATFYNEASLLASFLSHYRRLGVNHFIFIDNNSTDQGPESLKTDRDVSVFYTNQSYKAANFGMHWVNALLRRYGSEHWCLVCDIDEHLVFHPIVEAPPCGEHSGSSLASLCHRLERQPQQALYTIMLDMYPERQRQNTQTNRHSEETPLLQSCPYFDRLGYQYLANRKYRSQMIRGGVRQRLLYDQDPDSAPALQKIPLIKWRRYYLYLSSMHTLSPRRLNTCFGQDESGALLHFKFSPGYIAKVLQEQTRRQHYDNSSEYTRYQQLNYASVFVDHNISEKYQSTLQLVNLGLITSLTSTNDKQGACTEGSNAATHGANHSDNIKAEVAKNG